LDHRSQTGSGWGYCVFGRVIKGMDVVDTIERLPTGNKGMYQDVPIAPAIITKAVVQQPEAKQ
ncbi:MAG TPA: peptidylprolyl isomerase, partial [Thermodesulfobacteriota bacterium]|nr:peptidylprolyl isomerase [Thermodesulfobacteriota bacterium]